MYVDNVPSSDANINSQSDPSWSQWLILCITHIVCANLVKGERKEVCYSCFHQDWNNVDFNLQFVFPATISMSLRLHIINSFILWPEFLNDLFRKIFKSVDTKETFTCTCYKSM